MKKIIVSFHPISNKSYFFIRSFYCTIIVSLLLSTNQILGQIPDTSLSDYGKIPDVKLLDLSNNYVSSNNIDNKGKPLIIIFWTTWCKPCVNLLDTIQKVQDIWQNETGVKIFAISEDLGILVYRQNRVKETINSVNKYVNDKNWTYQVLLDSNTTFEKAILKTDNVGFPAIFIVDSSRTIRWKFMSFNFGDMSSFLSNIRRLLKTT